MHIIKFKENLQTETENSCRGLCGCMLVQQGAAPSTLVQLSHRILFAEHTR